MAKILVTGGAGFIGSHLADKLIELGNEVVIVDNLSTGKSQNLNKRAAFYNSDITDIQELNAIFRTEKPEIVYHLAAQISVPKSVENPEWDRKINVEGTKNILKLAKKFGVEKIIYSNSSAIFGKPKYLPINESHPTNPLSPYGKSKLAAEKEIIKSKIPYVSFRFSNVYGPRQNSSGEGGVIAIFTDKLLNHESPTIFGDGNQLRDYIYVKDIVEASMLSLKDSLKNEIFNVGTSKATSTQQIFENLKKMTKSALSPIYAEERKGDLKSSSLDSSKLQNFGFQLKYTLEQGLKETLAYFNRK